MLYITDIEYNNIVGKFTYGIMTHKHEDDAAPTHGL